MGDDLLKESSAVLSRALRDSDLICRLGGDEFLLILPECNAGQITAVYKRIAVHVEAFNSHSNKPYHISFSPGFSTCTPSQPLNSDELISRADDEMYRVKR